MQKLKTYFFVSVYLLGALGICINFHYCGGELVKVAFLQANEEDCCGNENENEDHCCDDTYVWVDTDDSENLGACEVSKNILVQLANYAHQELTLMDAGFAYRLKNYLPPEHAPPRVGTPIFLKNNIWRI